MYQGSYRAPHGTYVRRYERAPRTLADLQIEPFPDVSRAIPELSTRRGALP
jgi:hypothetical protein